MEQTRRNILPKNYSIDGKYNILLFIKESDYAQTYRVKGTDGKLYFLKLFNFSKLHRTSFDNENRIIEIELLKNLKHANIVSYEKSGEVIIEGRKYAYLILNFIAGETLADRISREPFTSVYDIIGIVTGTLNGLQYLHNVKDAIVHNEIALQNVMLDLSGTVSVPKIIDFGYARSFHESTKAFSKEGLNLNYVASECFNNVFSPQSDLFSVGALLYHLLYGYAPWFMDLSKYQADRIKMEDAILNERKKPLSFPNVEDRIVDYDISITKIIKKALHSDTDIRFKTAEEFLKALNGDIAIEDDDKTAIQKPIKDETSKQPVSQKAKNKGFSAIAGMKELKEQLQHDVINALQNPDEYERYGITIPNGMLLYGPPGCGKTFFSKRFAEEVGFNFVDVKPSSLQSRFINATQENIARMFEEAEKNAPTIIFIDELDALVPSREGDLHEMQANAVNEFLVQMNDCGTRGIFIIGASNRPEKIDPAVLRAGRLDKKIYLPPPDFEARKAMFEIYLTTRPLDFGIDYDRLAQLTENYVSADIELLVNDASRKALRDKSRISMEILEQIVKTTRPSVSLTELNKYKALKARMDSDNIGNTE